MDTRGRRGDAPARNRSAEVTTDTGSVQIVDIETIGPQPRSRRSSALLVAGVVAALAFGGVVALNRPALDPAVTHAPTDPVAIATSEPNATPLPVATPRPTSTPRPTPGRWVWEAYSLGGFDRNAELRGIWGFGNRFVALVTTATGAPDGGELHSLLVSTDGNAWSRAVLPAPVFEVEMGTVIDETLWLVGQAEREEARAREAWATTDGVTWARATGLEAIVADVGAVLGLALLPMGWAVLCARSGGPDALPVFEVRLETATSVWKTVEIPLDMHEWLAGFAGDRHGIVLLVRHASDEGDGFFDVRQSSDEGPWSVVTRFRSAAEITGLAVGPSGYVVVGEEPFSDQGSRPIGWWSTDGREWEEASMPVGVLPPGYSTVGAYRVVPTDTGFLAISQPNGMAWVSMDGQQWSAFNVWPTANDFMREVAVVGDRIVAIRDDPGRLGFLRGTLSTMR